MARKSAVKQEIFDVWETNLDWSPKEIRAEVHKRLGLRRSKNNTYPGLRLVQSYIKEFKDNLGQLIDEDKPWSIAASVKYGLPPEATEDLFDIWRASLAIGNPITIRQAKWIVHIRSLFRQPISTGNVYSDKVNRNLWLLRQSWFYSILERASRIMGGKFFDTANLDAGSFMPNWERATALKLGKVSSIDYSQEALAKLEKHGTSLTSPPHSVTSVEEAVWQNVRTEPPPGMEAMDSIGLGEKPLSEEDDLVSAYWLNYLSKGPKWESLDYLEQRMIRFDLCKWVHQHSNMTIRDYHTLTEQHPALVLSPKLLTAVGYEVPTEDLKLYAKLHENELKKEHPGWENIPDDVQQRFIHDEQTDDDLTLLKDADNQAKVKWKQREQEFIELVQQKGGVPDNKKDYRIVKDFWASIRDEWVKKYPEYIKKSAYGYLQWEEVQTEYERIIEEQKKEAHHERSHNQEVQK